MKNRNIYKTIDFQKETRKSSIKYKNHGLKNYKGEHFDEDVE